MECEDIKVIIPAYVAHTASSEEAAAVEEHLCVCNECRQHLTLVMDSAPAAAGASAAPDDDDGPDEHELVSSVPDRIPKKEISSSEVLANAFAKPQKPGINQPAVSGKPRRVSLPILDILIIVMGLGGVIFFLSLLLK